MRALLVFCGYFILLGCSFAPKYQRPPMLIPADYKETGKWVNTKSHLETIAANEPWWVIFHDDTLNALQQGVFVNNNNLKIALARYEEARALAVVTRSALFPSVEGIGTIARQKSSAALSPAAPKLTNNTFLLSAILNYEIDAWGRVRNSVIASDSLARASNFDLAAITLSLHAELASDYFQLRGYDEAQFVLDKTVVAYQKSLNLIRHRHQGGMVAESDVDEAITQLENAKTQAADNRLKRAQLEHAIAVLVGEIPANFSIKPNIKPVHLATIAPDLPSTLLVRRPDIAAANARVCAANAQIGVARAAYFPQFNLISLVGVESNKLANLFTHPNLIWSLGPSSALTLIQPEISQVIFDGFKLRGLLNRAKASYFEAVSTYRQVVLSAMQEVEDSLVAIHRLDEEKNTQSKSTIAAKRALYQANQQYQGGLVTYVDVVVYENAALQSELNLITIRIRRQLASVSLVKALGGGWLTPCCA